MPLLARFPVIGTYILENGTEDGGFVGNASLRCPSLEAARDVETLRNQKRVVESEVRTSSGSQNASEATHGQQADISFSGCRWGGGSSWGCGRRSPWFMRYQGNELPETILPQACR